VFVDGGMFFENPMRGSSHGELSELDGFGRKEHETRRQHALDGFGWKDCGLPPSVRHEKTSVGTGRANGHDEPRVTQCVFEGEAKDTRGRTPSDPPHLEERRERTSLEGRPVPASEEDQGGRVVRANQPRPHAATDRPSWSASPSDERPCP